MAHQVLLTGMRPTSGMHIGNYFGALKSVVELQSKYKTYLMVADMHALTTLEDTKKIGEDTIQAALLYIAGGVDPKKAIFFVQSQVPEQIELATIFSMITPVSMLQLNPVYKEMLQEHPKATNLGLLAYPVLQAADILAHKANLVPVGRDQLPHIELAREIARRFNSRFGRLFPEPRSIVNKEVKIFSLQDPSKKMSKSHSDSSQIGLLDSPQAVRQKIKSAVTDSGKEVRYDPARKPAISNLMMLMHLADAKPMKEIERKFALKGYKEFKEAVADSLIKTIAPIQARYKNLSKNKKSVAKLLDAGTKKARRSAARTLKETKQKIGLIL